MRKILVLTIMAVVMLKGVTTAQLEGDQWVLGYGDGTSSDHSIMYFDFRNGHLKIVQMPSILMRIKETASNICSPLGDPLLWTNGMQIMSFDNGYIADTIAYDGDGYYWQGFAPSGQPAGFPKLDGAIILPLPGNDREFSIIYFYVEEHPVYLYAVTQFLEARAYYDENSGFKILYQDKPIGPHLFWYTGTISVVRHANGRDWWIVNFLEDSPKYYVHLLDPSGLHFDHIGEVDKAIKEGLGQAVFSGSGNYFARMDAISKDSGEYITLFGFDRCTGDFNRKETFHEESGTFTGVAFSPSERYLYADNNTKLWQWDLQADDVAASKILVDTFDGFVQPGWFVMRFAPLINAPDGRIYIVPPAGSSKFLHVIERPDLLAPDCKFIQHEINIGIWNARTAPNIPNYRLGPLDGSFCDTLGLDNLPKSRWRFEADQAIDPLVIRFTDLAFYDPDTWHWDFGDGDTSDIPGPLHTFEPGYYHVCQTVSNQYATDSTCQWVQILPTDIKEEMDRNLPDLSIHPNPFHDFIVVESRGNNFRPVNLQIYDIQGRMIFDHAGITIPSKIYFPDFAPGLYFFNLTEEDGRQFAFKLMKE